MTKKVVIFSGKKWGDTVTCRAPGDTNPSDATVTFIKDIWLMLGLGLEMPVRTACKGYTKMSGSPAVVCLLSKTTCSWIRSCVIQCTNSVAAPGHQDSQVISRSRSQDRSLIRCKRQRNKGARSFPAGVYILWSTWLFVVVRK